MNNVMIFENHEVEVFEFNGEVLFNPYHVGRCLDIDDVTVRRHMQKMNDKQVMKLKNSDVQDMNFRKLNNAGENFLTERGVFKLAFKSHKPEAERFQDWVTDEVLPSIRKHGIYARDNVIDKILDNPDFGIELLTKLKEERQARVLAENKNAMLMHSQKTYTATEIAKELGFKSAVALNKDLCDKGIQYKVNETHVLYSKYADMGLAEIKQQILDNGKVVYYRRFTQYGREFLLKLYGKEVE